MTNEKEQSASPGPPPQVSMSFDPVASLLRLRALDPPQRPGLLASLDQYEILGILGSGGMGVVFLARDPRRADPVAIKVLRPDLAREPQAVHRFLVEARHMMRLAHPHIMEVLAISERPEGPYFVTPFMERGSLAGLIRPGVPLDYGTTSRVAREVAEALKYAHGRGIIHRDLKPANVLIGKDGQAHLGDFGLLRTLYNDSIVDVRRDQREGTAAYMSPGVVSGQAEDTRCDIYSFGAMLYEMLTGHAPYDGPTPEAVFKQIIAGQPAPIATRNPDAPRDLADIASGAMARELRDRYASMADVAADLERVRKGSKPIGPRGELRRRRRVSGLAVTCLQRLAVLVIVLLLGANTTLLVSTGLVLARLARMSEPQAPLPSSHAAWLLDTKQARAQQQRIAQDLGIPARVQVKLGNSGILELALIPAGKFLMGSPESELGRYLNETPQHPVTISKPFYIAAHEVTQGIYESMMGTNPSRYKGYSNPVESVTWPQAVEFCRKLSKETRADIRLPSEAEWEYACRAGSRARFSFGDDAMRLADYAWYGQPAGSTHPAGKKRPNTWGLYDMHGNVCEWCSDWYGKDYYAVSQAVDPSGPSSGTHRVVRGGDRINGPRDLRCAKRGVHPPERAKHWIGFRIVAEVGSWAREIHPPASSGPVFNGALPLRGRPTNSKNEMRRSVAGTIRYR